MIIFFDWSIIITNIYISISISLLNDLYFMKIVSSILQIECCSR